MSREILYRKIVVFSLIFRYFYKEIGARLHEKKKSYIFQNTSFRLRLHELRIGLFSELIFVPYELEFPNKSLQLHANEALGHVCMSFRKASFQS